jgi:hypothetical protein
MFSSFNLRCFQPLILLVFSAGFLIPVDPVLSLTPEEQQVFTAEYMKVCLEGINQSGLDPQQGEQYCRCTLNNLLKLPDQKLLSLSSLTEQQIVQDAAILNAINSCVSNYRQPKQ